MEIHVKNPSKPTTNCHRKFLNRLYSSVNQSEISSCRYCHNHPVTLCRDTLSTYICLSHVAHVLIVSSHVIIHLIRFLNHVILLFLMQTKRIYSKHALHRLNQYVCDIVASTTSTTTASTATSTTRSTTASTTTASGKKVLAQSLLNRPKQSLRRSHNNGNHGNRFNAITSTSTKRSLITRNHILDNKSHSNSHGIKIFRDARTWIYITFLWSISVTPASGLKKVQLSGYGASFPSTVYNDWITTFKDMRRAHIDLDMTYTETGSSKGVSYITGESDANFPGDFYFLW